MGSGTSKRAGALRCSLLLRAAAGALSVAAVAYAPPAWAQSAIEFNLPSQPLATAILQISKQADVDVMVSEPLTRGRTAPAVRGRMTAQQALEKALVGSGLRLRSRGSGSFIVEAVPLGNGGAAAEAAGDQAEAQGQGTSNVLAAGAGEAADQEIVVTGSHIRGTAPAGANLLVMDRDALNRTGRGTLAEAIQTMPQVHGGGANDSTFATGRGGGNRFGEPGLPGVSSLNLRGLGVEETLTLVNGRRLAPAGLEGAVSDISMVPFAAVERVEILADGASATYGADAMAGVVNIILSDEFQGAESNVRVGMETRSGQPDLRLSQVFGLNFDRGNLLLAGEYFHQDNIDAEGRPFAASQDLRPMGGSDRRSEYCNPGNIISPAGLAGAIPMVQDTSTFDPSDILSGQLNLCNLRDDIDLIPEQQRGSLFAIGSYEATDRIRLFASTIVGRRTTSYTGSPAAELLTVPTTNAFRQAYDFSGATPLLSQPIAVLYAFDVPELRNYKTETWSISAAAGAEFKISDTWSFEISGSDGWYNSKSRSALLDTRPVAAGGALATALASSDVGNAFDPFVAASNSESLISGFVAPFRADQESRYRSVQVNATGNLAEVPGGSVRLAMGGEHRDEEFRAAAATVYRNTNSRTIQYEREGGRDVLAGYAELFVPIVSKLNAFAGAEEISLSVAARYDDYSDFGGDFNSKLGLTWKPLAALRLRGTFGTSFKAPPLPSAFSASNARFSILPLSLGGPDFNGDGFTGLLALTGGNPDLGPERGRTWTVGVDFVPQALKGLHLRATYFDIRFKDRFGAITSPLRAFTDPLAYTGIAYFPGPTQSEVDDAMASVDIIGGAPPPAGAVDAIIDARTTNISTQHISGVDAGGRYRFGAAGGSVDVAAELSYLSRYKSRLGDAVSQSELLGDVGLPPRLQLRGSVGWSNETINLVGSVDHTSGYKNKAVTPVQRVDSYTTFDLNVQVKFRKTSNPAKSEPWILSGSVINLFDTAPPFVDNTVGLGYDGANANPIGRRLSVQLTVPW